MFGTNTFSTHSQRGFSESLMLRLLTLLLVVSFGIGNAHEYSCGHGVTKGNTDKLVDLHNSNRGKTLAFHRRLHEHPVETAFEDQVHNTHNNHAHLHHDEFFHHGGHSNDELLRDLEDDLTSHKRDLQATSTSSSSVPMRITVEYQGISNLTQAEQVSLKTVISATQRVLQKYLSVINATQTSRLLASPYCISYADDDSCIQYFPDFSEGSDVESRQCQTAVINPAHVLNPSTCNADGSYVSGSCRSYGGTTGVITDMYMYVTVSDVGCSSSAAAYALPCLLDFNSDRPVIGAANICPKSLKNPSRSLTAIVTHEFIHALGFTSSMFRNLHAPDGSVRPYSSVVQNVTVGSQTVNRIVTPTVRAVAQDHFNCSSLSGAQLETEGGSGSANSHWEYTLFQGELMVATSAFGAAGQGPSLSQMTLAYFNDSGWYNVNMSNAGLLTWGSNAGCALPTTSCSEYMASVPDQNLFCDASAASDDDDELCTPGLMSSGYCSSFNFSDGCGLLQSDDYAETCLDGQYVLDQSGAFGWSNSYTSRCMPMTFLVTSKYGHYRYTYPSGGYAGEPGSACFQTVCSESSSGAMSYKVVLAFGNNQSVSFDCPEGKTIELSSIMSSRFSSGTIGPCPSAADVCMTQTCSSIACNKVGGQCYGGTCSCRLTYGGSDCSRDLLLDETVNDQGYVVTTGSSSSWDGVDVNGLTETSTSNATLLTWVTWVTVNLTLGNSVVDVNLRSQTLVRDVAAWAGINAANVSVVNTTSASGGSNSSNSTANSTMTSTPSSSTTPTTLSFSVAPLLSTAAIGTATTATSADPLDLSSSSSSLSMSPPSFSTASASTSLIVTKNLPPQTSSADGLPNLSPSDDSLSHASSIRIRSILASSSSSSNSTTVTLKLIASNTSQLASTLALLNSSAAAANLSALLSRDSFYVVSGSLSYATSVVRSKLMSLSTTVQYNSTADESAKSSNSKSIVAIVIGVVFGALGGICIAGAALAAFIINRRRKNNSNGSSSNDNNAASSSAVLHGSKSLGPSHAAHGIEISARTSNYGDDSSSPEAAAQTYGNAPVAYGAGVGGVPSYKYPDGSSYHPNAHVRGGAPSDNNNNNNYNKTRDPSFGGQNQSRQGGYPLQGKSSSFVDMTGLQRQTNGREWSSRSQPNSPLRLAGYGGQDRYQGDGGVVAGGVVAGGGAGAGAGGYYYQYSQRPSGSGYPPNSNAGAVKPGGVASGVPYSASPYRDVPHGDVASTAPNHQWHTGQAPRSNGPGPGPGSALPYGGSMSPPPYGSPNIAPIRTSYMVTADATSAAYLSPMQRTASRSAPVSPLKMSNLDKAAERRSGGRDS